MAIFRQRQETETQRKWLALDHTVNGNSGARIQVIWEQVQFVCLTRRKIILKHSAVCPHLPLPRSPLCLCLTPSPSLPHFSFFLLYHLGVLAPFPSDTVVNTHELPIILKEEQGISTPLPLSYCLICLPPLSWSHIMDLELSLQPQPQIH